MLILDPRLGPDASESERLVLIEVVLPRIVLIKTENHVLFHDSCILWIS